MPPPAWLLAVRARLARSRSPPSRRSDDDLSIEDDLSVEDGLSEHGHISAATTHWEDVATALLDPVPFRDDSCNAVLVQSHRLLCYYQRRGFERVKRVGGRWYREHESMEHTWAEMLTGVAAPIRTLVVSTRCATTFDLYRTCDCEHRAKEVFAQCDAASRNHADEPPWDLLRIELFQAFGHQVQGETHIVYEGTDGSETWQALQKAHVLHTLQHIEAAARKSRERQYDQGKTDACLQSLDVAIVRSLSVAQNVFQATCKGLMEICVGTRAKAIDALMVRNQLVVAREELTAREAHRPSTYEEAVAKLAEAAAYNSA